MNRIFLKLYNLLSQDQINKTSFTLTGPHCTFAVDDSIVDLTDKGEIVLVAIVPRNIKPTKTSVSKAIKIYKDSQIDSIANCLKVLFD